jgi:hypothetical protein
MCLRVLRTSVYGAVVSSNNKRCLMMAHERRKHVAVTSIEVVNEIFKYLTNTF